MDKSAAGKADLSIVGASRQITNVVLRYYNDVRAKLWICLKLLGIRWSLPKEGCKIKQKLVLLSYSHRGEQLVRVVLDHLNPIKEWLHIRREGSSYTTRLSTAPVNTSLTYLAIHNKRSPQEAKREFGWDKHQATTLLPDEYKFVLAVFTYWFFPEICLNWTTNSNSTPPIGSMSDRSFIGSIIANAQVILWADHFGLRYSTASC